MDIGTVVETAVIVVAVALALRTGVATTKVVRKSARTKIAIVVCQVSDFSVKVFIVLEK